MTTKTKETQLKEFDSLVRTELKSKGLSEWDGGRFQKIRNLGSGTFGEVFSAVDLKRVQNKVEPSTVVVKKISIEQDDPFTALYAEIAALKALKGTCQHYVLCYSGEAFYSSDSYFLLTEYLKDYVPLDDRRFDEKTGKLEWDVTQNIFGDPMRLADVILNLIAGLNVVHIAGVAHRDIKRANILVQRNGTSIKFIDFGLAVTRPETDGIWAGTPEYMAPEIYKRLPFGPIKGERMPIRDVPFFQKCDIWSLGLVIWELCRPVGGGTVFGQWNFARDMLSVHFTGDLPATPDWAKKLPKEAQRLYQRGVFSTNFRYESYCQFLSPSDAKFAACDPLAPVSERIEKLLRELSYLHMIYSEDEPFYLHMEEQAKRAESKLPQVPYKHTPAKYPNLTLLTMLEPDPAKRSLPITLAPKFTTRPAAALVRPFLPKPSTATPTPAAVAKGGRANAIFISPKYLFRSLFSACRS